MARDFVIFLTKMYHASFVQAYAFFAYWDFGGEGASKNPSVSLPSPAPLAGEPRRFVRRPNPTKALRPRRARPPGRAAVAASTSPEPTQQVRHRRHGREAVPYKMRRQAQRLPPRGKPRRFVRRPNPTKALRPRRARPPGRAAVALSTSPEPTQQVRHRRLGLPDEPYKLKTP